jgi:hypothetical protein
MTNQSNQPNQTNRDASSKEKETHTASSPSSQQKPQVVAPISAGNAAGPSQSKSAPAASGEKDSTHSTDKKTAMNS